MIEDSETHTVDHLSNIDAANASHNYDPSFLNPFDDLSLNSQVNFNNTQKLKSVRFRTGKVINESENRIKNHFTATMKNGLEVSLKDGHEFIGFEGLQRAHLFKRYL